MPNGPSIKMHVQNVHTMDELKLTGNCLKGSRGLLSFDASFDETEWGKLTKEVFTHVSSLCARFSAVSTFSMLSVLTHVYRLDIRRATYRTESKAIHRSYPDVFNRR